VKPEIDHIEAVTVAFNRLLLIVTIPGKLIIGVNSFSFLLAPCSHWMQAVGSI
jgi:hypothetical protein